MSFLQLVLKNIWRRKLRTILTVCGVALGSAAFVTLVGFSSSFEREWLRALESSGTDIAVVQKTFLNTSVDMSVGEKLRKFPEIDAVAPMILNMMDLTTDVSALAFGRPDDSFEMEPLVIVQGRKFKGDAQEIMLGELLADNIGKKAGDRIDIQGVSFKIVGVFRGTAFETGGVLLPIKQLQQLSDLGDKVTAFHVRLKPLRSGQTAKDQLQEIRTKIETRLPGLKAVPVRDRASNNEVVALARSTAWGTSLIALFISALGIGNTMAISVFERTKDIGVLRALGWRRWLVMKLILLESAMLGIFGGLLGIFAGWGALRVLAEIPVVSTIASATIPARHIAMALSISLVTGLVAGLLPALNGARISPVEALRHD